MLLAWVLSHGLALAADVGLGAAIAWHDSPSQVNMGLGPELTLRTSLTPRAESSALSTYVGCGVARMWLVVPTTVARVEGGVVRSSGRWRPAIGAEVAVITARLVKVTTEDPTPPVWPPTSLRIRLRPLQFALDPSTTVSALELAPGLGLDHPTDTLAFGLTVFQLTRQWGNSPAASARR